MNLMLVQSAIDQALADASHKVLMDLSGNCTDWVKAQRMANAAQELYDALRVRGQTSTEPNSQMPSYEDQWIALAYAQWYQLRQIHLAYSLAKDLLANETIRQAPGHQVHDVGCGALAFAIGLALAVAECLEAGDSVGSFELCGYDCASLRAIGCDHWAMLRQRVGSQPQVAWLAHAMDRIHLKLQSFSEGEVYRIFADHPPPKVCRWLVAQHIAYEANQDGVRSDLAEWSKSIQPHIGLVTGPLFKSRVVHHINPFGIPPSCQPVGVTSLFNGAAPAITNHRAGIAGDHAVSSSNLLRENVSWNHYSGNGAPYALRYLRLPER